MPKFYVIEKYYYELWANTRDEVEELFESLMQNDPNEELTFLDNETAVYDEKWDEQ